MQVDGHLDCSASTLSSRSSADLKSSISAGDSTPFTFSMVYSNSDPFAVRTRYVPSWKPFCIPAITVESSRNTDAAMGCDPDVRSPTVDICCPPPLSGTM